MIIRDIYSEERELYNKVVSHILQTYEWGIFREATGVRVIRMGVFEGRLVSGYQLTIHPIPHSSFTVGYLPRGPEISEKLLENLEKIGRENNCIFIKIEPDMQRSPPAQAGEIRDQRSEIQKDNLLLSSAILPAHTFHVDLTAPEEEILKKMKEKTRYNIRLAEKQEVFVQEKNDEESLQIFIKLMIETAERQGFFSHPPDYYKKLWEILYPKGMCHLLTASFNKIPLAAIMLFRFKDMLYYPYGGSATVFREKMPNHLLHWEAIKLGKSLGCTLYDMWGAYKKSPSEKDPWFGIYRFKEGLGGKLVEYSPTVDLIFQPAFYKIYKFIDPLRFKVLLLRRYFHLK